VYHFAHWLYPKYLPLLAEQSQNVAIVEVVNRLFVFAEKYWIHELATECYKKIRMLFAHHAGGAVTAERLKALYDVHAKQSSMMKTFYLRLMVQRFSAQEVELDVQFLEGCFEGEPDFAREFFGELREHIKWRRAHPYHDRDLEHYLPPPLVHWWGEEEVVSVTDEGEMDERQGDQEAEFVGADEPQQSGTVETEIRRSADEVDMGEEYLDHVAKETEGHFDSVAYIDLVSPPERDQNNASAEEPALETDERNGDQEVDRVGLDQPQQNGTSEALTYYRADHIPPLTPFDSPRAMEQDNMSVEEPVARKPEAEWITIRVEDRAPINPVIKPEDILNRGILEQNHDHVATLHVPAHPSPITPAVTEAVISSLGVPGHTPLPAQTRPQPTGPNAIVQENGVGSASHPNHSNTQGTWFQSSPRHVPSVPRGTPPLPPELAPSVPLTGAALADQVLGYQAAYPAVQSFLKELVPEPSVADLSRVQDILMDNPATRTEFGLLKALFDPGDTLSKYPPMPPKEPKRKGRPPKKRKTFPGQLTMPPTPEPQKRTSVARQSGPSQTTRSWGSEEYQNVESDEEARTSPRLRTQNRGREMEKETEEPRPRRSAQRQEFGAKERKRMWDDFKIED
jgi:hypothetical protein